MTNDTVLYHHNVGSPGYDDITDYVITSLSIPRHRCNDDYGPSVPGCTLVLSENCPSTFVIGKKVSFTISTIKITPFVIQKITHSRTDRTYSLQLLSELSELSKYYITKDNLDAAIKSLHTDNDYKFQDNRYDSITDYSNIRVLWAITKMFSDAGLGSLNYVTAAEKNAINVGGTDYLLKDICIDYEMFYQLGQVTSLTYDPHYYVTYLEFIQAFCSMFGVALWYNGTSWIMIAQEDTNITDPTDDNILDYVEVEEAAKDAFYNCDIYWAGFVVGHTTDNINYYISSQSFNVNVNESVDTPTTFTWINNLRYLVHISGTTTGQVEDFYIDPITNNSGIDYASIDFSIRYRTFSETFKIPISSTAMNEYYFSHEMVIDVSGYTIEFTKKHYEY